MALVEGMEWFAKKHGCYIKANPTVKPMRGWVVFFDWNGDEYEDHVGIVLSRDNLNCKTWEGNRGNKTVIGHRPYKHISGYADFSAWGKQ